MRQSGSGGGGLLEPDDAVGSLVTAILDANQLIVAHRESGQKHGWHQTQTGS